MFLKRLSLVCFYITVYSRLMSGETVKLIHFFITSENFVVAILVSFGTAF